MIVGNDIQSKELDSSFRSKAFERKFLFIKGRNYFGEKCNWLNREFKESSSLLECN